MIASLWSVDENGRMLGRAWWQYPDYIAWDTPNRCWGPPPDPPVVASCPGWDCSAQQEGKYCTDGGYCCLCGKWVAGGCPANWDCSQVNTCETDGCGSAATPHAGVCGFGDSTSDMPAGSQWAKPAGGTFCADDAKGPPLDGVWDGITTVMRGKCLYKKKIGEQCGNDNDCMTDSCSGTCRG